MGPSNKLSDIRGSCLYQIPVGDEFIQGKYGDMFMALAKMGILPLGLLRCPVKKLDGDRYSHADHFSYVYTNPEKTTTLCKGDKVFCLSVKPISTMSKHPSVGRSK